MTYRECYEKGCLALQTAGIEEATLDARLLLEAVCGTNRNDLLVHGEQSVIVLAVIPLVGNDLSLGDV